MEIFIYSDESGTFDKVHNDVFVFGGIVFLNKEEKDIANRKYINAEKTLKCKDYKTLKELKACYITNKHKGKLFRSLNGLIKFSVVIKQKNVLDEIFLSKKDKQRFLDYAFKRGLKHCLLQLIRKKIICADEVDKIRVFVDEHTTATNGKYELRESLEQEFKRGNYNYNYKKHYSPIFRNLNSLELKYCKSEKVPLIRASDIVANRVYHEALKNNLKFIEEKTYVIEIP